MVTLPATFKTTFTKYTHEKSINEVPRTTLFNVFSILPFCFYGFSRSERIARKKQNFSATVENRES